ncbi:MAG: TonB-dependent receptor [Chitinophagaceae bacterium]|nr:TonB-dependent receptor [Chitinophagaceae bacterium]
MKRTAYLLLLLLLSAQVVTAQAQQAKITGKVLGEDGDPLPGVSVMIKDSKTGTVTDDQGAFSINLPKLPGFLVFSSAGYVNREVNFTKAGSFNVNLTRDPQSLKDVVIVGYGTVRRRDLTGSVGSINIADMQKAPVKSFDEALAGRVSGVQVVSSEGKPGSSISVVIRGGNSVTQGNSPLYVIDGFPMEDPGSDAANIINAIDPADIESIDILKDASATAIYGARGANGVVVITTKRGKAGKTAISYNTYYGWQESSKRLSVLDPYEFVKLQMEINPTLASQMYLQQTVDGVKDTLDLDYYKNKKGINWEDQIMRKAPMMSHHISINGGNAKTKLAASGSYLGQDGIIMNSGFRRIQGRLSIDHEASDKLKVGFNTSYANSKTWGTATSSSGFNNELNLLFSVWAYRPVALLNSNVDLLESPNDPEIEPSQEHRYNPIVTTKNELRENFSENFVANGYAEYAFLRNLKFKTTGGYTRGITRQDVFNNSQTRNGNPTTNNKVNGGMTYFNSNSWLNENTLTWNQRFNSAHNLTLMGGFSLQGGNSNSFGAYAKELPNEGLGLSGLDEGKPLSITSTSTAWSMASFLARANYQLFSKYLFTASFRADGSSRFVDHWGYFPSAAFAWRLGSERWMKQIRFLSDAKIRAGWGITGNNNVGNFSAFASYVTPLDAGYSWNNQLNNGSYPSSMGNSKLKWEPTTQMNLGLDLEFFAGRLKFTGDLYRKNTDDLLLNANLPGSTGYTRQFKNIGKVRNEGIELDLQGTIIDGKDFRWNSGFNISFNRNKVLQLADGEYSMLSTQYWGDDWVLIPGYIARLNDPVAQFYGMVWDGVYTYDDFDKIGNNYILKSTVPNNGQDRASIKPGHIKYKDLNGDRVIDNNDRTVIGNPLPIHTGGFSNNFFYKGFDLNVLFQWSYGNDIYNANTWALSTGYKFNTNQYASYADRWSPDNQDSKIPVAKGSLSKYYSTRMVEDGSFLRLKTVSLGYNFSPAVLKKAKISAIRVYVTAQNIYTWTNYSGYDPEVSVRNSALTPGFDYSAYPRAKTMVFGLNATF